MPPPANPVFCVDDVADSCGGPAEDRAQVRAQAAAVAKTWESLLDDQGAVRTHEGIFSHSSATATSTGSRKRPRASEAVTAVGDNGAVVQRAMVRYLLLLLDLTEAARQSDYKPRRLEFGVEAARRFARKFMAENPLAELALGVFRGGTCQVAAPLCTNADELEEQLQKAVTDGPQGKMSISSGLVRARALLEDQPPYGAREVLLIFSSLSNWDPVETPVDTTLGPLTEKKIRVSVVSMSPETYILRRICAETGGHYGVALGPSHFEELLFAHVPAPVCGPRFLAPKLVRMGFPRQVYEVKGPAACACHLKLHSRLFLCPQCHSRVCKVPTRCPCCELPLVSAPLLARSFRQLRPLQTFAAVEAGQAAMCCGCQQREPMFSECPRCKGRFCESCDDFMHDALQQCPGCLEGKAQLPAS